MDILGIIDWSLIPVLLGVSFSGGGGSGSSQQSSQSSSNTGLPEPYKGQLSSFLAPKFGSTFFPYTQQAATNPAGTPGGSLPGLSANGLFPAQQTGFDTALRDATATASSGLAQRGFVRPENTPEVAAQGLAAVAPSYLNQSSGNIQQVAQYAPVVQAQTFTDYLGALQQAIAGIGGSGSALSTSTSQGSSSQNQFGLG